VVGIHLDQGYLAAGRKAYEDYRARPWAELRVEPSELMSALIAPSVRTAAPYDVRQPSGAAVTLA
jgi:hypothetical protein